MSDLSCPHCMTSVPMGARVCTGCQAEIEYGPPTGAHLFVLLAAAGAGAKLVDAVHPLVGIVGFAVVLLLGARASSWLFRGRVVFKRHYWTQ